MSSRVTELVEQTSNDDSVSGVILCDVTDVSADGALSWRFREVGTSVAPGAAHAVRPGDLMQVHSAGELAMAGRLYRVEPGFQLAVTETGVTVRDLQGEVVEPLL